MTVVKDHVTSFITPHTFMHQLSGNGAFLWLLPCYGWL